MSKFLSKVTAPAEIIRIIAAHEPLYLFFALPQVLFNAALPLLYVYFPRLIIEQLTNGSTYSRVVTTISVYAGILLIINMANVFLKNKSDMLATTFSSKLKNRIGVMAMQLELKDIESTTARDAIHMAGKAAGLTSAMGIVQNIVSNIITIAGLVYLIVQVDWLFILLVIAVLAVKTVFVHLRYLHNKKIRALDAENGRHGDYLYHIAYSEGGAKEIRLNSLQQWYMGKIKIYRNTMLNLQFGDFKRFTFHNIVMAVILAVQSFVILWFLSRQYISGNISIAEFTMYFAAVAALTGCLSTISEQLGEYGRQVLSVSDYKGFHAAEINPGTPGSAPVNTAGFTFSNVSFTYPNTDRQILDGININIRNNEKLVIVGANGAGKSTFIKLLCKFYRPTSGVIMLNGVDIWDIPNDEYYKIIAAVFQDFANFAFTLKENICMSEAGDTEKTAEAIRAIGLDMRVKELPCGYDTYLTKNFDTNGIEFSGGQAQKIAIARAIYKDAPVLILDEPTASLDPKAESEIYTDFFNMAKDKTAIFISHRLAASTIADNIAVFSGGKIVEYGTHNSLIKLDGVYAEMYRKQSQQYY